jgi:signal transduction histidine kinase
VPRIEPQLVQRCRVLASRIAVLEPLLLPKDCTRVTIKDGDLPRKDWLVDGGELGDCIRSVDWSASPLGPRGVWPASLRAVVNVVVGTRFPMALVWGRESILIYNDAYREIAGERHPRALGRSTREIWPEVWHINEPIFAAVMERGESIYLEDELFPIEQPGGRQDAYFTLCYGPVRVEDGTIGGVLVTLQETTARVAERDRLVSERRRALDTFEHGEACIVLDGEYRVVLVNREQERIGGKPRSATLGRVIWDVWPDHADPANPFRQAYDRVMRERCGFTFEAFSVPLSAWLDVRVYPMADGGLAAFFHDATARKSTEAELLASEARFRALVLASSDVLYRMSPDWREMRNLSSGKFLAETVEPDANWTEKYIHPDDRARVQAAIDEAIRYRGTFELEHRVVVKDGGVGWTYSRAIPLKDAAGKVVEWFGVASDVTARKRAEEALRASEADARTRAAELLQANERLLEADRRKNDFLGMLSHELRNPLAPIRNSLYILDRAPPGGEAVRRAKEVAARQVTHLARLVDDLLDVTRIARRKIELRPTHLDVAALVRRTAEDHQGLMHERTLEFRVDVSAAPAVVHGDETRLAQVIGNLLQNAAKFTPPGGAVSIALHVLDREAEVRVRDTGRGIEPALLADVFEPFVQAQQSIDRPEGGLGLGLALVKSIVDLHGGTVWAASEGTGMGTQITVRLPLADAVGSVEEESGKDAGAAPSRRRVLVVDDNRDAAESLADIVAMFGHSAEVAFDGPSALERARANPPEIVLCDLGLPGMSGFEVARVLRSERNEMKLVAVSGYAHPDDVRRALDAGFDGHVAKPVNPIEIERLMAG